MKELSPEDVVLLSSMFATEIAKDKSIDELNQIKLVLSQVISTLGSIILQRIIDDANKTKC